MRFMGWLLALLCAIGWVVGEVRAESQYLGCFQDNSRSDPVGTRGRTLAGSCFSSDGWRRTGGNCGSSAPMTVEQCVAACRSQGFALAGLQYSHWCFCGNELTGAMPANNCNMPCPGNSSQMCGGSWANSVYRTTMETRAPERPPQRRGHVETPRPKNPLDCVSTTFLGVAGNAHKTRYELIPGCNVAVFLKLCTCYSRSVGGCQTQLASVQQSIRTYVDTSFGRPGRLITASYSALGARTESCTP
jgi:hypothetical protein